MGERLETRSYSLIGLPEAEVYRIAVKRADPGRGGSRWMWGLETGDELRIGEPNNHFELALGGFGSQCLNKKGGGRSRREYLSEE